MPLWVLRGAALSFPERPDRLFCARGVPFLVGHFVYVWYTILNAVILKNSRPMRY